MLPVLMGQDSNLRHYKLELLSLINVVKHAVLLVSFLACPVARDCMISIESITIRASIDGRAKRRPVNLEVHCEARPYKRPNSYSKISKTEQSIHGETRIIRLISPCKDFSLF